MIFGIKTKKDKLIEKLEEIIEIKDMTIKSMVDKVYGRPYIVPDKSFDYIPVKTSRFLQDEIPLDLLKHDIDHKMAEFLEDQIHFEVIEVDGRKFLEGTLNVRREK